MNRILRAPWHDYTQRCIYMVTLNKFPGVKDFGTLEGDFQIAVGQKGGSFVSESENGRAIKEVLRRASARLLNLPKFQSIISYRSSCFDIPLPKNNITTVVDCSFSLKSRRIFA